MIGAIASANVFSPKSHNVQSDAVALEEVEELVESFAGKLRVSYKAFIPDAESFGDVARAVYARISAGGDRTRARATHILSGLFSSQVGTTQHREFA